MSNSLTIARKEFRDIVRSRMLLVIVVFLAVVTVASILVSAQVFQNQVSQYNQSVQTLQQLGKSMTGPAPELFPLNLLRGVIDYFEIIGAVLGILLGYLTISREKNSGTLNLILTRPVSRTEIAAGKIMGNGFFVALTVAAVGMVSWLGLFTVGGVALSGIELVKLGLALVLSFAYIMVFFALTFILSMTMRTISHALIIAFVIWLGFVLILPQIGDTMDPDNQVPGGFFASMHLTKPEEKQLMTHFSTYETIRNGIEEASVTKHYERTVFALLGIKKEFNGISINSILATQWTNILVVSVIFLVGLYACDVAMRRRHQYFQDKET